MVVDASEAVKGEVASLLDSKLPKPRFTSGLLRRRLIEKAGTFGEPRRERVHRYVLDVHRTVPPIVCVIRHRSLVMHNLTTHLPQPAAAKIAKNPGKLIEKVSEQMLTLLADKLTEKGITSLVECVYQRDAVLVMSLSITHVDLDVMGEAKNEPGMGPTPEQQKGLRKMGGMLKYTPSMFRSPKPRTRCQSQALCTERLLSKTFPQCACLSRFL